MLVAEAVLVYGLPHWDRLPLHDSVFRGEQWLNERLHHPNPINLHNALGVSPFVFQKILCDLMSYGGLTASKFMSTAEKLAIFLWVCREGSGVRRAADTFQRAIATIAR